MERKINIGLYLQGHDILNAELFSSLLMNGFEPVSLRESLSRESKIERFDVLVFHPPYNNVEGEWNSLAGIFDTNPDKLFYMFAINASERQTFFGTRRNLRYVIGGSFFENPTEIIIADYEKFKKG